jgi:hypothetical protein
VCGTGHTTDARTDLIVITLLTIDRNTKRVYMSFTRTKDADRLQGLTRRCRWQAFHANPPVDTSPRPILWFDRHHPSAPTRLRATASAARSVLDGREHDGRLDRVGGLTPHTPDLGQKERPRAAQKACSCSLAGFFRWFAQRLAVEGKAVRGVHEAVEDGIGDSHRGSEARHGRGS